MQLDRPITSIAQYVNGKGRNTVKLVQLNESEPVWLVNRDLSLGQSFVQWKLERAKSGGNSQSPCNPVHRRNGPGCRPCQPKNLKRDSRVYPHQERPACSPFVVSRNRSQKFKMENLDLGIVARSIGSLHREENRTKCATALAILATQKNKTKVPSHADRRDWPGPQGGDLEKGGARRTHQGRNWQAGGARWIQKPSHQAASTRPPIGIFLLTTSCSRGRQSTAWNKGGKSGSKGHKSWETMAIGT